MYLTPFPFSPIQDEKKAPKGAFLLELSAASWAVALPTPLQGQEEAQRSENFT